jgi:phage terminase large subunit
VVAELHGRLAPEVFAQQLNLLGRMYGCGPRDYRSNALTAIERSHSSGQTVLRLLNEELKYRPLFWNREINRRTRKIGRRIGWITDVTSRMPMLDELGRAVREDGLELPGKDLVREMTTFVVWPNGKPMAEEGCHDDRVIALAIAWQMATREHFHGSMRLPPPSYVDTESQTGY